MHSVDKSRSSGGYHYRLYLAYALIRHYLTIGRKYALIKKYTLNMHVRLLIRLYGIRATYSVHIYACNAYMRVYICTVYML